MRTRRRRPPARSLPGMNEDPRRDPCRGRPQDPGKTLAEAPARPLPGPRPNPCRGRLRGRSQACTCQSFTAHHTCSNVAASPPPRRVPAWQHTTSRPTSQAPAWWHADLREDPATAPTQQPASQHGAACLINLDATEQGDAATDGTSFVTDPHKERGHVGGALNAFVP